MSQVPQQFKWKWTFEVLDVNGKNRDMTKNGEDSAFKPTNNADTSKDFNKGITNRADINRMPTTLIDTATVMAKATVKNIFSFFWS